MSPHIIFNLHLVLGYVAWLLCFRAYLLPSLKSMDQVEAHRAIATLHSFRFANEYPFIPLPMIFPSGHRVWRVKQALWRYFRQSLRDDCGLFSSW